MRLAVAVIFLMAVGPALRGMVPNGLERIPRRNIFGLKGPEAAPRSTAPAPSLPKITLTGITTILGQKLVLLKAQPPAPKGGQPPKTESMILAEGQQQGPIKVLSIDVGSGDVKLDNSGTLMTLNLQKDGARLPVSPASTISTPTKGFSGRTSTAAQLPVRAPHWRGPYGSTAPATALSPTGGGPLPPGYAAPTPPNLAVQNLTAEEQAIVQQLRQLSASQPSVVSPPVTGQPQPPVSGAVMVPPGAKPPNTIPPGYTQPAAPK